MTDGVQRVFGMEYQPIKDLEALAPAGMKVVIFLLLVNTKSLFSVVLSSELVSVRVSTL